MNYKKWQGIACLLLASLMMTSVSAAPVRNEAPAQTSSPKEVEKPQKESKPKASITPPKSTETPQPADVPKITPKPSETPKATEVPKATEAPKPATTPKLVPKVIETPKAAGTPQVTPKGADIPKLTPSTEPACPKPAAPPKVQTNKPEAVPKTSDTSDKDENPCKKTCPNKPFTLDHFKMIVNTLKQMGVEENEIITYIKDGKKLEDILAAEKISPRKFKKNITKEYYKVVDEAQKSGQITCEQSKQLKAAIKETIKNWLPKK